MGLVINISQTTSCFSGDMTPWPWSRLIVSHVISVGKMKSDICDSKDLPEAPHYNSFAHDHRHLDCLQRARRLNLTAHAISCDKTACEFSRMGDLCTFTARDVAYQVSQTTAGVLMVYYFKHIQP